jgi:Initiator Replication protein
MENLPAAPSAPEFKTPQELVHVKHTITLLQYKYWLLMLKTYREHYEEHGPLGDEFCYLSMAKLADYLGYEPKKSDAEEDLEALRQAPIIFNVLEKDGKPGRTGQGFIAKWFVSTSRIGVRFDKELKESVHKLDSKSSIFHILKWSIFNSFSGKHEAFIFNLCRDYVSVSRTPYFPIEKFRDYMGLKPTEYKNFKQLNQWVISKPVKKINDNEISDIVVEAEFVKEKGGRKIVGLSFIVKPKAQTILDFGGSPAFLEARVLVPFDLQKKYLTEASMSDISTAIERANEYADGQISKGIDVNYTALYRNAIEKRWGETISRRKSNEQAAIEKVQTLREKNDKEASDIDYRECMVELTTEKLKELSAEAKCELAREFSQETGAISFNPVTRKFENHLERTKFAGWLRTRFKVEPSAEQFDAWKADRAKSRRA